MGTGEFFTAPVERIAAGGDGVLRYRGRSLFMSFTAPGDLVVGRITGEKSGRAELVELAEASPHRTAPVCPLYGNCGGCSLQHLSYGTQIAEKGRILRDALIRIGGHAAPPEIETVPSPPYEYRNRMRFHRVEPETISPFPRGKGKGRITVPSGLMGRKSGTVVPLPDCPVADPLIRAALREGRLRPPPDKDRFTVYGRGKTLLIEGERRRGRVSLLGRELVLDGGVFFQSNGITLEALIRDLVTLAGEGDTRRPMADLYAGVGTFSAFLGDYFPGIDLLEENRDALVLARENVPRGRYFAMTDDRWVKTMSPGLSPYGFAVADPPRRGLSRSMARWLSRAGPPVLAYVSCDPATLARDSRELTAGGYGLATLRFYDFYPQTAHIESLAVFKKNGETRGA
ncbi:MAG: class I SAM-dependent RNA methyltransferase [Spirochaetaceae bacterium]|jgi:23S rRNA (uracil1939-C5)-methyltransferase|nr:class I SAM-dependent RNA methyltransferase [Spirochaetaceae bacterium]